MTRKPIPAQQDDLFALALPPPPLQEALPAIAPDLWERLARSAFRSRFHLGVQERAYLEEKGERAVLLHGQDFIAKRLAPAHPARDGRQTPWKGHPVFVAQHATATCCRGCLHKWHGLPQGVALDAAQQVYVLAVIAAWIEREAARAKKA
ncbi:DUF4186 domain-containing protein [Acetobacter suratthaniensis]|uniref:DUF4186 domain-containing protein n=1 Tax=Acetobacter suratthaniensis TaxID=1502841 RepID=A0ABS3LNI3_9PROT|nr:DUF4186 domain-containing protein [Acetobacter suratthaniensis]MBO1328912.1 DUF4186 domain-containing protein [Acetobacter suratthaniensis]MCX2567061.1 DUF4186 domain-containing protein [Acetobacter suratthaniensis]